MQPILRLTHQASAGAPRFLVAGGSRSATAPASREVVIESPRSIPFVAGGIATLEDGWRWYLETYRARPLEGFAPRVSRLMAAFREWGGRTFEEVFRDSGIQVGPLDGTRMPPVLEIYSHNPDVLAWPWELLSRDGDEGLGPTILVERRLVTGSPSAASGLRPGSAPLRILMLSARKGLKDVDARVLSLPLAGLPDVELKLVRPPSAVALERELASGGWDVLHLDCHGWLGSPDGGADRPHLLFETESGRPAPIDAKRLIRILDTAEIPQVVMSACRSAMPLDTADEGAGSMAASILVAEKVCEVVAMAFEVQTEAAQNFTVNYYATLAKSRDTRKALRRGQMALGAPDEGYSEALQRRFDWMIPVLYRRAGTAFHTDDGPLPRPGVELRARPPVRGRVAETMILDRLLTSSATPILIEALKGQGSSALVESVLDWRRKTGDVRGLFAIDFEKIHFDGLGILGMLHHLARPGFAYVDEMMARNGPFVVVIDHVDIVPANWQADLLRDVGDVLIELHRRGCSVIGISRTSAPWFRAEGRSLLAMGGLDQAACADLIARGLHPSRRANWSAPSLRDLARTIAGHPATAADLTRLLNEQDPSREWVSPVETGDWGAAAPSAREIEATLRALPPEKLIPFTDALEATFAAADDERVRLWRVLLPDQEQVQLPESGIEMIADTFAAEGIRSGLDREGLVYRGMPHPQLAGALRRVTGRELDFSWFVAVANRQKGLSAPRLTEEQIHAEVGLVPGEKRLDVAKARQEAIELTRRGEHAEALKLIKQCIDFENSIEAPALTAMNQTILGQIQASMGDLDAADASFAEAVHTFQFYEHAYDAGITLNQWAGALAKHGQFETAGELLIAAALQFQDEDDRMVAAAAQGFVWALGQMPEDPAERLLHLWREADLPDLDDDDDDDDDDDKEIFVDVDDEPSEPVSVKRSGWSSVRTFLSRVSGGN